MSSFPFRSMSNAITCAALLQSLLIICWSHLPLGLPRCLKRDKLPFSPHPVARTSSWPSPSMSAAIATEARGNGSMIMCFSQLPLPRFSYHDISDPVPSSEPRVAISMSGLRSVSYTHLTLPTNREV